MYILIKVNTVDQTCLFVFALFRGIDPYEETHTHTYVDLLLDKDNQTGRSMYAHC